jgi:transcriptional regulator with XRE-family HTH domain
MSDVNPIDMHVGRRLQALREAQGMSAEILVRAVGMSIDRLERLESGRERINVDDMRRLCEVLGATPADFFRGINDDDERGLAGDDLPIEEEGRLLLTDFRRIADPKKRRVLMALAAALAQESGH